MGAKVKRSIIPSGHNAPVEITLSDWKGGLNKVRSGLGLTPEELPAVRNFKYVATDYGLGLMSREGLKKQTTTAAGAALKDLAAYVDTSGDTTVLGVADSDLFKDVSGVMTKVDDLAGARGRMLQFNNVMCIADGSYLKYYDGSSLSMAYDSGGTLLSATDKGSGTDLYSGATTRAGQKFTTPSWDAGFTLPLTTVTFWLGQTDGGSLSGNCACKAIDASDGTTVVATSANVDVTGLTAEASGGAEQVFTFTGATLDPGTAYYFVVEYSGGDASNYITVHYTSGTTASGNHATYNGSWADVAGDSYIKIAPGLAPQCSMLEQRHGRLLCDDQAAGQRNWLHVSNASDQNQWTGTGTDTIVMEGGAYISAIKSFYGNTMVHLRGGTKAIYKLTGTSSSDFVVTLYLPGAAAVNQDVVHNIGNDYLFLDDAGVVSLMAWERTGDFEYAIRSDKVKNTVNQSVGSSSFAGYCSTEQQYWLDVGDSDGAQLIYDGQYKAWTEYLFMLGTGVTPSCFGEWGGDSYVGDSAGHYWKLDIKSPQYTDGGTEYMMSGYVKFAPMDFGTKLKKHIRLINVEARARLSATFDLELYKDLSATAFREIEVSLPIDPDVTLDELTMTLDEMTFPLDDLRSNLFYQRVNFECKALQLGIENIDLAGSPLIFHFVAIEGALLSRR